MLDPECVQIAKDNIKRKMHSIDHQIAKYICALTAPVKEHDWDDWKAKMPAQMAEICERIKRFERLRTICNIFPDFKM